MSEAILTETLVSRRVSAFTGASVRSCARALFGVIALLLLQGCSQSPQKPSVKEMSVSVRASRPGTFTLYVDRGHGYASKESVRRTLADTRDWQTLTFTLHGPVDRLRLDPFDGPGDASLRAALITAPGVAPVTLPFHVLATREIVSLTRSDDELFLRTTREAKNPSIEISGASLRNRDAADRWLCVTPLSLSVAGALLLAAIGWSLLETFRQAAAPLTGRASVALALSIAAIGMLVWAAKLWLISAYGSSVPFLDQWNGEALAAYLPFSWGELRWPDLFAAHNEHRIALTRVLDLILVAVNDQWDPRLQLMVNAALHTLAGLALLLLLWRQMGRRALDIVACLILLAWALPFAWENTLFGFQGCFYWLTLLFVLPLSLLPDSSPGQMRWWAGSGLLLLGLFSVASGVFSALAVGIAIAGRAWASPSDRLTWLPGIISCAAIAALGIWLMPDSPAEHAVLRARTIGEFATLVSSMLAWPFIEQRGMAMVMWAPLVAAIVSMLRQRRAPTALECTVLALTTWVGLHALAAGVTRANASPVPSARYMDILSLGFVANGVVAWLLMQTARGRVVRSVTVLGVGAWALSAAIGLGGRMEISLARDAHTPKIWSDAHAIGIRQYLMDGNGEAFRALKFPGQVPYSQPEVLASVYLDDPTLQRILPPSIRRPLPLRPADGASGFVPDGAYPTTPKDPQRPSWGSFSVLGNPGMGKFLSFPIRCSAGGHLRIDVAGYLGYGGTDLRLVEVPTEAAHDVRAWSTAREEWLPTFVRCPAGPFHLAATDATPKWWFAVREPVEYGPLSRVADGTIRSHRVVLVVGIVLCWAAIRVWRSDEGEELGRRTI